MIFSHGVHGDEKAFSQKERTPVAYASGFSAIHFAGCRLMVSSSLIQPQCGQAHVIGPSML